MADMETKYLHSFSFLEANKREYCEDQTPSDLWRTDNDIHDDHMKDDRSENTVGIV